MNEPNSSPRFLASLMSRAVAYALPVAYFLITVSFYLRTYDSAQIKITFTQIGCAAIILLWGAQLLLERRWPFTRDDFPYVAPFVAFLISGIVSFTQSSFVAGSLDEFLRRVLYCFMGIIVIVDFRGWDRHRRLLRWLLAAFGVVVFYGTVQYFDTRLFPSGQGIGLDPFVWRHAFGLRPFSSFGNPNFYGNFLVIITPIILSIYLRAGGQIFRPYVMLALLVAVVYFADKLFVGYFGGVDSATRGWVQAGLLVSVVMVLALVWWKTPTAAAAGMLLFWGAMFLNLYSTETKGAWLGFLGAISGTTILVGLFFGGENARRVARRLLTVVFFTLLIGVAIVGYYARQRFQSVSFRVFTWIGTWEMIRAQPIFGSGIGSFKWAYPAYRRPEIILVEGKSNTETDHAEDEYLEVWYDEGIVGFGIFLWLILTVSWAGLKALGLLTRPGPRGPPHYGERAYSLLAYLGAFWGALVHWFVDVSVRFVSSGIYSVLLPGLVMSLVRNEKMIQHQDPPCAFDRWIRTGVVIFWGAVMLSLDIKPLPVLACIAALWLLGEALEWRLAGGMVAGGDDVTSPISTAEELETDLKKVSPWQAIAFALLLVSFGYGYKVFRDFFRADVHHNLAIFFSKNGLWSKSPEFDPRTNELPPDMQAQYRETGGALEQYERVVKLNPFFPMAKYFIGNVYNDWGSSVHGQSMEARQRGDQALALKLKARAEEMWGKALAMYTRLKKFAPNYVQVHHQVGLVYLKFADMENAWGNPKKANEYWDLALQYFKLYNQLDPVFPPNYYRAAYIHFSRGEYEKAEKAYLDALKFNEKNVVGRIYNDRNVETYVNLGRLFYVVLANKYAGRPVLPSDSPEFKKAETYYNSAVSTAEKMDESGMRWKFDAMKGLAILYSRAQVNDKAGALWNALRQMNPDDPDVKSVFGGQRPGAGQ